MSQPNQGGQVADRAAAALWAAQKSLAKAIELLAKSDEHQDLGIELIRTLMSLAAVKDKLRGQAFFDWRQRASLSKASKPRRRKAAADVEPPPDSEKNSGLH